MALPYTFLFCSLSYKMSFPILSRRKRLFSFPRRWLQDNLQSGANKWGIFIPALGSGPGGGCRQRGTCPGQGTRGWLGRPRPGHREGGRWSHSPRASGAWLGAGWGRSSCCRGRRRCTSSGQCRPAARAASGWSRNSHTRGSRAGPPAGLQWERDPRPGEAAQHPLLPEAPAKTPSTPRSQCCRPAACSRARALPHGSLCSEAEPGAAGEVPIDGGPFSAPWGAPSKNLAK